MKPGDIFVLQWDYEARRCCSVQLASDNPAGPSPAPLPAAASPPQQRFALGFVSNPAGNASLTVGMAGIGSALVFTPVSTGRALVIVSCVVANGTAADGFQASLRFGTGTAPVNGAALTGLPAGPTLTNLGNANTAALGFPVTLVGIATGLTLGVPVWVDIAFAPLVGGTATITSINAAITEF